MIGAGGSADQVTGSRSLVPVFEGSFIRRNRVTLCVDNERRVPSPERPLVDGRVPSISSRGGGCGRNCTTKEHGVEAMSGNIVQQLSRVAGLRFVPYSRAMTAVACILAIFTVLAEPSMRPGTGDLSVTVTSLIVLVSCLVTIALVIWFKKWALRAGLAVALILVIAAVVLPYAPGSDGHVGTGTLVLLAAAVVASAFPVGWAMLGTFGCFWVMMIALAPSMIPNTVPIARILYSVEVLSLGVSLIGIGVGLAVAHRRVLAAREEAHQRELLLHSAQEASQALATRESRIHDLVLNTLTTIARTPTGIADLALRARALQAARELEEISTIDHGNSGNLREVCGDVISRLTNDSVKIEWLGADDVLVDGRAKTALISAVREALLNAWEHASATHVKVMIDLESQRDGFTIRIHDDGVGFDRGDQGGGFGLLTVLGTRLHEAGLKGEIVSDPGVGTTVTITGVRRAQPQPVDESWTSGWIAGPIAYPVLLSSLLMMAVALVLTLPTVARPVLDLAAGGILVVASAALLFAVARSSVGWVASVIVLTLGVGAYAVQVMAEPQSDTPWGLFSVGTLAVLLATLCMIGPPRVVIVCVIAWVVLAALSPGEGLQGSVWAFNGLIVVGGAGVGGFLRRSNREASHMEAQSRAAQRILAAEQEIDSRMRAREALIEEAGTSLLLKRFSHGELEALPPAEAARHELYLRSVMGLDPTDLPLHRWAGELARQGWRLGIDVSIRLAPRPIERLEGQVDGGWMSAEMGVLNPSIAEDELISRILPGASVFVTEASVGMATGVRVVTYLDIESIDEFTERGLVEVADEETGECVLLLTK